MKGINVDEYVVSMLDEEEMLMRAKRRGIHTRASVIQQSREIADDVDVEMRTGNRNEGTVD